MSSNKGTKRKNGEEPAIRDKKKQKVDFRTIAVQSSSVGGTGHGVVQGTCFSLQV